jgi:hypothetical protein
MGVFGAHGLQDPDFPGALQNRGVHGVHHAHPAHKEGDPRNPRQEGLDSPDDGLDVASEVFKIGDLGVPLPNFGEMGADGVPNAWDIRPVRQANHRVLHKLRPGEKLPKLGKVDDHNIV